MSWVLPFFHRRDDLILGRSGPWRVFPAVRLRAAQRATHSYVLGITGQGKSKLLQHLLFQDIIAGRGCGLLDPHSDLARDLLASLAERGFFDQPQQAARLIYFDPARRDTLIPFNVLQTAGPPYTIAANVVEAFRRTWPESLREAPRFSNILLAALLVLIANRLSLVELPRLLADHDYREDLLARVDDAEVVSVFHDRLDKWGRERALIVESILNKVSAFTLNPVLRGILGQPDNRLDFRRLMDEGRVLIADLGRCDGETRRLLGSLIVTGIEQAALSRKDEPTRARRNFAFILDEFQDFVANDGSAMTLSQILSESRKFGLSLTLAHQTLGQLESERMRATLGNIGTQIVFAVDRADAEVMARKLFLVDGEQVKHEVEDEGQQEKSHPVYYSLGEQWEGAVQAIQQLKPRVCFVKRPQRRVVQMHTIEVPEHRLSTAALDALMAQLARQHGRAWAGLSGAPARALSHRLSDYEPSRTATRQQVTGLPFA